MNLRVVLAGILWRAAVVIAVVTASITGSVIVNQNINATARREQNLQSQITTLNKQIAIIQKSIVAGSSSNASATQKFVDEINYMCIIEADVAKADGFPPPSSGVCDLEIPAH